MGLFFPEDPHFDESQPLTGFYRYRQLLADRFWRWWKVNLITLVGFLPLALGVFYAVMSTSLLVMLPCSILGGVIAGPFLAGMYDAVLRGFRDDFRPWRDCWLLSWRQNWKGSLLPGGVLGLFLGVYSFMAMLLWWADRLPSLGTVSISLCGPLVLLMVGSVYWPQLVLFRQKISIRLKNCLLFTIRYFWRVLGVGLLQMAYWAVFVLFAPWTLLLLPVLGIWYVVFLSQFLLYDQLDEAFGIEEQYRRG